MSRITNEHSVVQTPPLEKQVAWANEISTGLGLNNSLTAEQFNRFIVENDALVAHDAVMAIAGVGIERHVGHHRHAGVLVLDAPNRPGD